MKNSIYHLGIDLLFPSSLQRSIYNLEGHVEAYKFPIAIYLSENHLFPIHFGKTSMNFQVLYSLVTMGSFEDLKDLFVWMSRHLGVIQKKDTRIISHLIIENVFCSTTPNEKLQCQKVEKYTRTQNRLTDY